MRKLHDFVSYETNKMPGGDEYPIGFSDRIILSVSIGGFIFLAVTIYHIAMLHWKSGNNDNNDLNKDNNLEFNNNENYDEQLLAHADISTLNRGQRRARAKLIMKQTRRQSATAPQHREGELIIQQIEADDQHHNIIDDDDAAVGDDNASIIGSEEYRQLTRKERQHVAKIAEQRARLQLDDERRRQHDITKDVVMKEKQVRLKQKEIILVEERQQRHRLKDEYEKKENQDFLIFYSTDTITITVEEWINELQQGNRVYDVNGSAISHDSILVTSDTLFNRIETLLKERRVGGIIDKERGIFVYLNDDELLDLSNSIFNQGSVSLNSIVTAVSQYIH